MGNYNFKKDLQASHASVNKVVSYLESKGCYNITANNDSRYDLSYVTEGRMARTCEVKEDLMSRTTGNVAIEFESRGKPSGISTSIADKWYYILGNDIYVCQTGKIRVYLIQHWDRFKRISGGDDKSSLVALLRLADFKELFIKI